MKQYILLTDAVETDLFYGILEIEANEKLSDQKISNAIYLAKKRLEETEWQIVDLIKELPWKARLLDVEVVGV